MKAVLFDSAGTDSAAAVDLDLAQSGKEKLYWILGSTEDEDLSQAQPTIAAPRAGFEIHENRAYLRIMIMAAAA